MTHDQLSLAAFMELPYCRETPIVAIVGTRFLDRELRWVCGHQLQGDAPQSQSIPNLREGDLLVATDTSTTLDLHLYEWLIQEAVNAGACGLLIHAPAGAVPSATSLESAESHGMPVLISSKEISHSQLVEGLQRCIASVGSAGLQSQIDLVEELAAELLSGAGYERLAHRIATIADAPIAIRALDGRLVAASDDFSDRLILGASVERTIELGNASWGTVSVYARGSKRLDLLLQRAATAIALLAARGDGETTKPRGVHSELLRDLAFRRYRSAQELEHRADAIGFDLTGTQRYLALYVRFGPGSAESTAIHTLIAAAERMFGTCLVAEVSGDHIVAARTNAPNPTALRRVLDEFMKIVGIGAAGLPSSNIDIAVASEPVATLPELSDAIESVRDAKTLAPLIEHTTHAVLTSDLGTYRFLQSAEPGSLLRFVTEQLGMLVNHDRQRASALVETLDTFLAHGMSKAATANALGIRRQSLYYRLNQIQLIIGDEAFQARPRRIALELALMAKRMLEN